jgi:hypothetical protein
VVQSTVGDVSAAGGDVYSMCFDVERHQPTDADPAAVHHGIHGLVQRPAQGSDEVGVLIAIGYKEFSQYLDLCARDGVAADDALRAVGAPTAGDGAASDAAVGGGTVLSTRAVDAAAANRASVLAACVSNLKAVTRRYARTQDQWIRNRFVKRGVPVTKLDTSDVTLWQTAVLQPACDAVAALLRGDVPRVPLVNDADRVMEWRKHECTVCQRQFNGQHEWQQHVSSQRHRRQLERAARLAANGGVWHPSQRTRVDHRDRPAAGTSAGTADGDAASDAGGAVGEPVASAAVAAAMSPPVEVAPPA